MAKQRKTAKAGSPPVSFLEAESIRRREREAYCDSIGLPPRPKTPRELRLSLEMCADYEARGTWGDEGNRLIYHFAQVDALRLREADPFYPPLPRPLDDPIAGQLVMRQWCIDAEAAAAEAQADKLDLDETELAILRALGESPAALKLVTLGDKTDRDPSTVGKRLPRLRELGLTYQSGKGRSGEALTPAGRDYLAKLSG